MIDGWEILIGDGPMARRGVQIMQAMVDAAPAGSLAAHRYTGRRRGLMIYGAGLHHRAQALRRHIAEGGRVAVWDLGYWDRDDAMRLSVDGLHPTADQLALAPAGCRRTHDLREDGNQNGPILLIGLGHKSAELYGVRPMEWERRKLQELWQRFPGREILWRPKRPADGPLPGATMRTGMPIEDALRGCSLVVCRHSNVGVDACIAGVPVETEDGAARALYASNPAPTRAERAEFLRRLGWWNWRPTEAPQAWAWINRIMENRR